MDPHFDGVIFQTHAAELIRRLRRPFPPFCVVDARWRGDFDQGHIPGAYAAGPDGLTALPPGTNTGRRSSSSAADPRIPPSAG